MTLKDLRERTKRACHEVRQLYGGPGKKLYEGLTMRQAWEENQAAILPFLRAGMPAEQILRPAILDFHLEGEIYYHAKKHGLKSAMLLKLSRP